MQNFLKTKLFYPLATLLALVVIALNADGMTLGAVMFCEEYAAIDGGIALQSDTEAVQIAGQRHLGLGGYPRLGQ